MPYCLIANQIIKTVFVAYEASKATATVTSAASSVTITILYLSSLPGRMSSFSTGFVKAIFLGS